MTLDIEAIRQSPRQYVDLETVEWLSDRVMILEEQLSVKEAASLSAERNALLNEGKLIEAQKQIKVLRDAIKTLHHNLRMEKWKKDETALLEQIEILRDALIVAATGVASGAVQCAATKALAAMEPKT